MTPDDKDRLIMRYLDRAASTDEVAVLAEQLRSDAELRLLLRDIAEQAVSMADFALEQRHLTPRHSIVIPAGAGPARQRTWWLAAACVLLVVGTLSLRLLGPEPGIARIGQVGGAVSFAVSGEAPRAILDAGEEINAGTLRCEGAASSVELLFDDGTSVTLVGDSELLLPAGKQKVLTLNEGSLTATVRPQQPGRPMVIHTPSADVEVLGTQFSLTAERASTRLLVESGSVQLRRRADGSMVKVPQGQEAVAGLGTAQAMQPQLPELQNAYRQTFEQPPAAGEHWHGQWESPSGNSPGRMHAVEDVSWRKPDGTPVVAYVVSTFRRPESIATVTADSQLRLRLRAAAPHHVLALLGLRNPGGGWYGNFQTVIKSRDGAVDADGWRTVELPLSALRGTGPRVVAGSCVCLIYVAAYSPAANLEVAELSLTPAPATPPQDLDDPDRSHAN